MDEVDGGYICLSGQGQLVRGETCSEGEVGCGFLEALTFTWDLLGIPEGDGDAASESLVKHAMHLRGSWLLVAHRLGIT